MKTRTKGCLAVTAVAFGVLALAVVVLTVGLPRYQQRARKAWKDAALPEIRQLADDPEWLSAVIERLSGGASGGDILAEHWLSENMILMLDGEWLVYKSHCSKVPPHHVRDIFLAKGSNGKWYYSTFHFCVGMCVLVMMQDAPPLDLETFARVYHLKEFDGVSDECLQQTRTFPDDAPAPNRTYTAGLRPGTPDLAPLSRIAAAAIPGGGGSVLIIAFSSPQPEGGGGSVLIIAFSSPQPGLNGGHPILYRCRVHSCHL